MSETYTTYGVGPDKPVSELQALRDENARLRRAAKEAKDLIHEDIVKGDKAGRRLKAEAILWAALTPQAGKGGGE